MKMPQSQRLARQPHDGSPRTGERRNDLEDLRNHVHVLVAVDVVHLDPQPADPHGLGGQLVGNLVDRGLAPARTEQAQEPEKAVTEISLAVDQELDAVGGKHRPPTRQAEVNPQTEPRIGLHDPLAGVRQRGHVGHQTRTGRNPLPKRAADGQVGRHRDSQVIGVNDQVARHVEPSRKRSGGKGIAGAPSDSLAGVGRNVEADQLLGKVEGPTLDLDVDPADVFADHADGHQLHAAQKQDGHQQRGPTGNGHVGEQGA